MKITCVAKAGSEKYLRELDLNDDVYFIELRGKVPMFHTKYGAYYQIVTLDSLKLWLKPYGYRSLDSVNIVKLDKIIWIDEFKRVVHFENKEMATISKSNLNWLKKDYKYRRLFRDT